MQRIECFNWRLAVLLGFSGCLATALLIPYVTAVMPQVFRSSRFSLGVVVAAQLAQAFVFLTLMSWIGLRVGAPLGLDAPHLRSWLAGKGERVPLRSVALAVALGVGVSLLILELDRFLYPLLPAAVAPLPASVDRWRGLLASFYGGVGEEIQIRLFLMSGLAWIGWRIVGRPTTPSQVLYWSAIALSAIAFGIGHLPLAFHVWVPTFWVILRTILLNALGGAVFGWLFWKHGLEFAMLCHFTVDLCLHVASPI